MKRVKGVPKWVRKRHADPATGAFGGTPYRATKLVEGVQSGCGCAMRTLPLGPSVEPPIVPRS
eukprot:2762537-Pyramimonas_sp.AAC.1